MLLLLQLAVGAGIQFIVHGTVAPASSGAVLLLLLHLAVGAGIQFIVHGTVAPTSRSSNSE